MTAPDQSKGPDEPPRSGLRNPPAAARGVGAGALVIEAVVLLLAIQPLRVLGVRLTGTAVGVVIGLAVACLVLAGLLRHDWAWYAGAAVQVVLVASGFAFHGSLAVSGLVFGLVWAYVLHVRRTVLRS
jgi:hypothetical protein